MPHEVPTYSVGKLIFPYLFDEINDKTSFKFAQSKRLLEPLQNVCQIKRSKCQRVHKKIWNQLLINDSQKSRVSCFQNTS